MGLRSDDRGNKQVVGHARTGYVPVLAVAVEVGMENRFVKAVVSAVEWTCTGTLGAILIMVFLQILFRDVLKISAPWTEEGARYLLVAMVYLGAVVALERRSHVTLSLKEKFGHRTAVILDVFSDLVVAACSVIYVIGSVVMTDMNWHIQSITIRFVPIGILYVFSAVGAVMVALLATARVIVRIAGR